MRCKLNQQTREKNLERRQKGMKRLLISVILVIALLVLPVSGVLAATSQQVTVTAVPGYISIAETQTTWTINGITGNGFMSTNTTYYANPTGDNITPSATVLDTECYFTITNTSSVNCTITVNFSDFTGGDAMTNGDSGSAGATTFGAYSYHEGMTYAADKKVAQTTGSPAWSDNLTSDNTTLDWGVEITTQTNDWTSGTAMSGTVTITATLAP